MYISLLCSVSNLSSWSLYMEEENYSIYLPSSLRIQLHVISLPQVLGDETARRHLGKDGDGESFSKHHLFLCSSVPLRLRDSVKARAVYCIHILIHSLFSRTSIFYFLLSWSSILFLRIRAKSFFRCSCSDPVVVKSVDGQKKKSICQIW